MKGGGDMTEDEIKKQVNKLEVEIAILEDKMKILKDKISDKREILTCYLHALYSGNKE